MNQKVGGKIRDKIEEEASREAIIFYRAWRQKTKNAILPIGIANVGKTTFLQRFEIAEPNIFLEFNRTLETSTDKLRLRQDLAKFADGVEYYKKIDVPGDLPDEWAIAYHDNNPRVLVIMVDDRDAKAHTVQLRKFLARIVEGPSFWQSTKTVFAMRWDNLSRVLFVTNKADRFAPEALDQVANQYREVLADIQSTLKVPIQLFRVSLSENNDDSLQLFRAVVEGLTRK